MAAFQVVTNISSSNNTNSSKFTSEQILVKASEILGNDSLLKPEEALRSEKFHKGIVSLLQQDWEKEQAELAQKKVKEQAELDQKKAVELAVAMQKIENKLKPVLSPMVVVKKQPCDKARTDLISRVKQKQLKKYGVSSPDGMSWNDVEELGSWKWYLIIFSVELRNLKNVLKPDDKNGLDLIDQALTALQTYIDAATLVLTDYYDVEPNYQVCNYSRKEVEENVERKLFGNADYQEYQQVVRGADDLLKMYQKKCCNQQEGQNPQKKPNGKKKSKK